MTAKRLQVGHVEVADMAALVAMQGAVEMASQPISQLVPDGVASHAEVQILPVLPRDRTWGDLFRARALLRAGLATVDRVLGHSNNSDADPQVMMALTETSQATHRALVKLTEIGEMLADLSREHPSQRPMSEDLRAEALSRLEAS
jgi:hypothetical protein